MLCGEAAENGVKEQQQPVAYHNNGGVILNRLFPTRVMCKAVQHHCKKKEDFWKIKGVSLNVFIELGYYLFKRSVFGVHVHIVW